MPANSAWKSLSKKACLAAERGRLEILRELGEKDRTLLIDGRPRAPLWLAARNGQLAAVRILVESGADPCREDWDGTACSVPECPMQAAARAGHTEIVKVLEPLVGALELRHLIALGRVEAVRSELARDPDAVAGRWQLPGREGCWMEPMHFACFYGDPRVVDLLLGAGGDSWGGYRGQERPWILPLHLALGMGHVDVVRLLLKAGTIPASGSQVCGAYSLAGYAGSQELIDLLRSCDLDINARRDDGEHCAHVHVRHPRFDPMCLLLDNGVDIDAQRRNGRTMLHFAASMGLKTFLEELAKRGADPNLIDSQGKTAYELASRRKNPKAAELMRALVMDVESET